MAETEKKQRYKRGENPNSKKNLKPFKPGESGNPLGNHTGSKHRATLLREVVDIIGDFKNPITKEMEKMLVEKRIEYAIVGKAMAGDVPAYKEIKDSLYGKISDKTEVTGKDGSPLTFDIVIK